MKYPAKNRLLHSLAWVLALFAHGSTLLAFQQPAHDALPNFDKRADGGKPAPAPEQARALDNLRGRVPRLKVDFDPVTRGPRRVSADNDFLTGPAGRGKGVTPASAVQFANQPHPATRAFLQEHRELFGHGPEALNSARVVRDDVTRHNGLRTVVWEQTHLGIGIFEATLIAHTTRNEELVQLSGRFLPDTARAAARGATGGNNGRSVDSAALTAVQSVVRAARNIGVELTETDIKAANSTATDAGQRQKFKAPGLKGDAEAKLTWLPMSRDSMRLCWDVVVMSRQRGEMYRLLVDANSGEILLRRCLTSYLTEATYNVYTSDSPSPFSPGWSTPNTNQPPFVSRTLVTLAAMDTNASPAGWINDGGNETLGNNVDAHLDRDANDAADLPRPQGSPFRVFNFPMDPVTQDPTNYSSAAVVQLFYLCNWYHDRLYQLGFTEAAGNFQSNNFSRGGAGNDAVQADAQDGSGTDNANFSTPPDGSAGRMQMYLFSGPTPRRDGDFDAEIVFHEYTHGLSWRLVGGGQALGDSQSDGMGEGWSDFYGLSLLSEAGDDVNGNYAAGGYATFRLGGLTQNYYYGIRRYPYSTDMSKNPLTFKDIDPAQASPHTGIPRSPVIGNTANEVHNQGEVWCVTLWEARANLIAKYGWATGNELMLQLVTDGMKLTVPHPNFIEARDGILQADLVNNGGANRNELWAAFAKRGLGFSATSPASTTTSGVVESYDLPDDLQITPKTRLVSSGPVGGPFNLISAAFTLTNIGVDALNWTLSSPAAWLDVTATNGTLDVATSTSVTTVVNQAASNLPAGLYTNLIVFSNVTSGLAQTRSFLLRVGQPDYFTELFAGTRTNDLAFQSFTFTPDGSTGTYAACREAVAAFPTDPTGGTVVTLTDDSFTNVTLSGTNTVAIYNRRTNSFFIGSNGYLTMDSGDTEYTESYAAHFNLPRVTALMDDLNPATGGTVSWKQTADRVAVTYQNVPEYGVTNGNSFQIELFFNGRIRITYLQLAATDGLAGLSAGLGEPAGFVETDLSTLGCASQAPFVWQQPSDLTRPEGTAATFSIGVFGNPAPAYYWRRNGTFIPGATNATYTTNNILQSDSGTLFSCLVSNALGIVLSSNAVLTVSPPPPLLSIANAVVTEGNSGTTNASFLLTLASAYPLPVTVNFATAAGTAAPGVDFIATNGLVTFSPGQTNQTIVVRVIGDTANEANETFLLNLSNPTNATLAATQATGTILNDDFLATVAAAGAQLTYESFFPTNGAIDPGETIQVRFALTNASTGGAATSNLVATLLNTGGVTNSSAPQSYGALTSGGPTLTQAYTFRATGVCGDVLTATLQLQDGTNNLGTVSYNFNLGSSVALGIAATNSTSITIPSAGNASPYPATNKVAGLSGTISKVTVTLRNLNHTYPDDLDILLVGPGGQKVMLMSDAGGQVDLVNVTLTLDDAAAVSLPDASQITNGTYRPTDFNSGETVPAPAPAGPYGTNLSVFNGTSPNGDWKLYINDDASGDSGSLAAGWSLNFTLQGSGCITDSDGDGIPDTWELANGLNPNNPADAALDTDGDGLSNLQEYLAGTDPRNPDNFLRILSITLVDTNALLSFPSITGRLYRAESTEAVGAGTWTPFADNLPGTGSTLTVTNLGAATAPQRVYRVKLLP